MQWQETKQAEENIIKINQKINQYIHICMYVYEYILPGRYTAARLKIYFCVGEGVNYWFNSSPKFKT